MTTGGDRRARRSSRTRAVVIGGSGFIGSHLCPALRRRGYEPVVVDPSPPRDASVGYVRGTAETVADGASDLLDGAAAVIHLAWTTTPQSATERPRADLEANVAAGLPLLERLARMANAPRLIFSSTGGAIYGSTDVERISEDHPTRPLNAYGVSKLAFEHYLRLFRHVHGLDYVAIRPSNPYGEFQSPDGAQGAVAVFFGKLAKREPITVWGDGAVVRDYFHVGDLANAIVAAIDYVPAAGDPRVFNAGSGAGVDLRSLIETMSAIAGVPAEVIYAPARKLDAPRIVLDVDRIRTHLGWQPTTKLRDGLTRTWEWMVGARAAEPS